MQHLYSKGHYNAIFLQPTTACAINCAGCYLKKYEKVSKLENTKDVPKWMERVTNKLIRGNRWVSANQISISLNNIPNVEPGHQLGYTYGMAEFIWGLPTRNVLDNETNNAYVKDRPEIHFTISLSAIHAYQQNALWERIAQIADVVTVSVDEFKWGGDRKEHLANFYKDERFKHINFNLMFSPGVIRLLKLHEGKKGDRHYLINYLLGIGDSVHFVAYKPDLGQKYTIPHVEMMRYMIDTYNSLPNELKNNKVFLDGCVDVCSKAKAGCQAGINLMTLWPNGRITGCPYSSKYIGGMETRLDLDPDWVTDELLQKMRDIRDKARAPEVYEFNKCEMRKLWPRQT